MTIFTTVSTSKFDASAQHTDSTLRSLLATTGPSKPIQIKTETSGGSCVGVVGHHHAANHLQHNYLDASCLTKAKLNECLNKTCSASSVRAPFKAYKPLDWSWSYEMESSCNADSPPLLLSADAKTVCFHPYCMGCFETNAIRVNRALKLNAFTYWEVSLPEAVCGGTSVMVGVGRRGAKLNANGYINLIGADQQSWGLSNKGALWHDNETRAHCPPFDVDSGANMRIGCLFDGYHGRLAFFRNGVYLGVAFDNLITRNAQGLCDAEHELYAMVSSTVSKSMMRLEVACESFATLKEMCRERVQQQIRAHASETHDQAAHNVYETFIYKRSSLATYLPKTVVDYLSNK